MIVNKQVEIPLSKVKLILMITGSIVFVAGGFWLIIVRPVIPFLSSQGEHNEMSTTADILLGAASILFFGLCGIFISKKLFDNTPGLIINNEGINDNSSGVSAGLILWKDVREIKKTSIRTSILTARKQYFITIIVNNPEEYINRQTGFIKRKAMEMNYKYYDSPISISSNGLKCNFDELYQIIQDRFNDRNKH